MVKPINNKWVKKIVNSDGFRIYFWPITICWITFMIIFAAFMEGEGLEPDSKKETVFVTIGNILFITLLWTLAKRYKKVKGRPLNKKTIIMLSILTAIMSVGLIIMIISLFSPQQNI